MILNVNTDAVKQYSKALDKMHRSALPVAIRGALNNAAFDVKQNTMPRSSEKAFINRSKNFFKANSRVEPANGFNVNTMKATVGFLSSKLKGQNNFAVKDLEQQEGGGKIGGRDFVPLNTARSGKSKNKLVVPRNRLSAIKNVIQAAKVKSNDGRQRFIRAAAIAWKLYGRNGFVLGNVRDGNVQTLSRIDGIRRNKSDGHIKIRRTPLYTYTDSRNVKVAGTNFMKRASYESGLKIERYYIEQAQKQINKVVKEFGLKAV